MTDTETETETRSTETDGSTDPARDTFATSVPYSRDGNKRAQEFERTQEKAENPDEKTAAQKHREEIEESPFSSPIPEEQPDQTMKSAQESDAAAAKADGLEDAPEWALALVEEIQMLRAEQSEDAAPFGT